MHYLEAYRAAPEGPEGDAATVQARIALRAAAERAEALGAIGQAVELQRAVRDVVREPHEVIEVLQEVGRLQWAAGRFDEAEESLAAAIQRTRDAGDAVGVVRATALLGMCLLARTEIRRAIDVLDGARDEAEELSGGSVDQVAAGVLAL